MDAAALLLPMATQRPLGRGAVSCPVMTVSHGHYLPMTDLNERVIFPDRGVKRQLGRVFGEMAFGTTRPRNMMPMHLTATADGRAMANVTRRQKHQKKVENH